MLPRSHLQPQTSQELEQELRLCLGCRVLLAGFDPMAAHTTEQPELC